MTNRDDGGIDVLCIGRIILDIFFAPLSRKDKVGNFLMTEGADFFIGGAAGNTAYILKRVGSNPTLAGLVGTDIFGELLIERLKQQDLYNPNIKKFDGHTTTSFITTNEDGEPRFIQLEGVSRSMVPSIVDLEMAKKCKFIHIGGIFSLPGFDNGAVKSIIDFARENKIKISADTTRNISNPGLIKNYGGLDVLFTNYEEASAIANTGDMESIINFFKALSGIDTTVIKMGAEGCVVISRERHNFYSGFKIEPIDRCGAGDAFVAGFLHGLLGNWGEKKTAAFANACGAFNCLVKGATNEAVTKDAIFSRFNIKES